MRLKAPKDVTAHKLISNLCVEMANEIYEEIAVDNKTYGILKQAGRPYFVSHVAPTMKRGAVALLAQMLGDDNVNEKDKERIYEALILDKSLPKDGNSYTHK